jgi:hypothetical protein
MTPGISNDENAGDCKVCALRNTISRLWCSTQEKTSLPYTSQVDLCYPRRCDFLNNRPNWGGIRVPEIEYLLYIWKAKAGIAAVSSGFSNGSVQKRRGPLLAFVMIKEDLFVLQLLAVIYCLTCSNHRGNWQKVVFTKRTELCVKSSSFKTKRTWKQLIKFFFCDTQQKRTD